MIKVNDDSLRICSISRIYVKLTAPLLFRLQKRFRKSFVGSIKHANRVYHIEYLSSNNFPISPY